MPLHIQSLKDPASSKSEAARIFFHLKLNILNVIPLDCICFVNFVIPIIPRLLYHWGWCTYLILSHFVIDPVKLRIITQALRKMLQINIPVEQQTAGEVKLLLFVFLGMFLFLGRFFLFNLLPIFWQVQRDI